ncbi:MAG: hypothetical protein OEL87_00645 [Nanoarchaeota archaeon]|nr:hypothetical protein [Nanoarchaeota archaeon]
MAKKKIDEKTEVMVPGAIEAEETRQFLWLLIVVGVIFATVLFSYFWVEGAKTFEHGGASWTIEDYDNLRIYHGRFLSLGVQDLNYNIYLRGDPRESDVSTNGTFNKFKHGGVVSMSPEIDKCRGELSRVMLDLGAFMRQGIGVGALSSGSTDKFVAVETDRLFTQCNTASDKTIVIVEMGEPSVVQNDSNPYCYTIKAKDCSDISSVERFMVKSIEDSIGSK